MKKLILYAALVLVTASCTKNSEQLAQNTTQESPSVTSYSFSRVSAGSNESVRFNVVLNVPSPVKKFSIYRVPAVEVWYVDNPESKAYVMYDHIITDYPTYGQNVWYYFVWTHNDGTQTILNKFQVY